MTLEDYKRRIGGLFDSAATYRSVATILPNLVQIYVDCALLELPTEDSLALIDYVFDTNGKITA